MDKVKTLSQAIRLGATLRPQCKGALWQKNCGVIQSCALGAAYEAVFGLPNTDASGGWDDEYYESLHARFPELVEMPIGEVFGGKGNSLQRSITIANDHDNLSREQIADELERIGL